MSTASTAPRQQTPPAQPARKPRMTLDSVRAGPAKAPDRILVVGTEGVGKTTFAAQAPSPIFICAENGIPRALSHIKRFPEPETFEDVLDAIRTLIDGAHEYQTLVIDTVDWLEPIVWAAVCRRHGWKDSEGNPDIEAPGYGKGYAAAADEWRRLLSALEVLRAKRGMEVILLAHAAIKVFQNPAGADYSRYECKLNKSAAALLKEWTDVNLFATQEELNSEEDITKRGKGTLTQKRIIFTQRTAAWDAKNRYGLPAEIALSYEDYAEARDREQASPYEALREEFVALLKQLGKTKAEGDRAVAAFDAHRQDAVYLSRQIERLKAALAEKGAAA